MWTLIVILMVTDMTSGCASTHGVSRYIMESARKKSNEKTIILAKEFRFNEWRASAQNETEEVTEEADTKFDNPDFIPGDFLDKGGKVKYVHRPPSTVLMDFLAQIDHRQEELWKLGVFVVSAIFLMFLVLLLGAALFGLFVTLYNYATMMENPMDKHDKKLEEMFDLMDIYEKNPEQFAHLPGFEKE